MFVRFSRSFSRPAACLLRARLVGYGRINHAKLRKLCETSRVFRKKA